MSQEVLEFVQGMDMDNLETQLALQCAPLIAGLKASNLFITQNVSYQEVQEILRNTNISCQILLLTKQRNVFLLYHTDKMEACLSQNKAKALLREMGYQKFALEDVLPLFRRRYYSHMRDNTEFPHEMGVLLDYPIEDVEGFIKNQGKNFLYRGYWKVYENPSVKLQLFQKFESAKEALLRLIQEGISIVEMIYI